MMMVCAIDKYFILLLQRKDSNTKSLKIKKKKCNYVQARQLLLTHETPFLMLKELFGLGINGFYGEEAYNSIMCLT